MQLQLFLSWNIVNIKHSCKSQLYRIKNFKNNIMQKKINFFHYEYQAPFLFEYLE